MKYHFALIFVLVLLIVTSCGQGSELTEDQKATIKAEVKEQYDQSIANLSKLDINIWAEPWSENDFISVISGTNHYSSLSEYKDSISTWFSYRERQNAEILTTEVNVLTSDLVLLSSITNWDILFKNEMQVNIKLYLSILWKKETDGWKMIYLHESY